MSYPPYPDYKDSGVEWLGEVPSHWALKKIKYVALFSGGGTPSRDIMAYWNGDIPWVSPKDMKAEEIQGAEECISEVGLAASTSNLVSPGTVLMVVRSGILKHTIPVAINRVEVALNQDMKALTFHSDLCLSRFFLRWVQGLNDELLLAWAKQGATVESLEQEYLANTAIPLPPVPEQSAIAAFLDRETGKIDALVAEQEQLIALLKEKRQAVISHAVTKGLDPSVPLKDSGIEWLGEVPAHWDVSLLKRAFRSTDYGISDSLSLDGDVAVLRMGNIQSGRVILDGLKYIDEVIDDLLLEQGDLLFNRTNSLDLIGKVGIFVGDSNMKTSFASYLVRLRVLENFDPNYFSYLLNADGLLGEARSLAFVAIGQCNLNPTRYGQLVVAIPPDGEQRLIAGFLDRETQAIDALAAEAQRAIDLLKERRSALISAAVTGKIDVRGLVSPQEAA